MARVVGLDADYPVRWVARSRTGQPMAYVTVTVTDENDDPATVYSDPDLSVEVPAPVTDANGVFSYFLPEGTYSFTLTTSERYEPIEDVEVTGGAPDVASAGVVAAALDQLAAATTAFEEAAADPAAAIAAQAITDGAIIRGDGEYPVVKLRTLSVDPLTITDPVAGDLYFRFNLLPSLTPEEFEPIFWFDAIDLNEVVADAAAVSSWRNLGTAGAATQATAGFRPVMDEDGLNGHPCVVFDGVDDVLKTAATSAIVMEAMTLFIVAEITTAGGVQTIVGGTNGTGLTKQQAYRNTATMTARSVSSLAGGTLADNTVLFWACEFSGATSKIWRDGSLVATGDTGLIPTGHLMTLGADNSTGWMGGKIGSAFAIPRALSESEFVDLHAYQTDRWAA